MVALLDELSSGIPTTAAPEIRHDFALSYSATSLVVFVIPGAIAFVLEPIAFLIADRYPRRWFVSGALGVMAIASAVAAVAPNATTFTLALACWASATGVAASLAQVALIDRAPARRARVLARWTLLATIGDLLGPLALAGLAVLHVGWRAGFVLVAGVLALSAIALAVAGWPAAMIEDADDRPPLLHALRTALRDRVLLLWMFGVALCDLLDEILVVFAALRLRELGASAAEQSLVLGAFIAGGLVGLVVLERVLASRDDRRVLVVCCLACAVSYVAWLAAPTVWLSAVLIFPVGATAAPLYPLAAAQAYARSPEHAGVVAMVSQALTPIGLLLPWLLGVVADHTSVHLALALLVVQPVLLALLARRK